jgi:hypothetical protein
MCSNILEPRFRENVREIETAKKFKINKKDKRKHIELT